MAIENPTEKALSWRSLITFTGTIIALIGLVLGPFFLSGCPSPSPVLLYGQEMVGKVSNTAATIRLVAGEACTPSTQFSLLYDTISREDPTEYAFQTSAISGFSENDPINFDIASLPGNTRIYYRVAIHEGDGWVYRNEYSFRTKRLSGSPFRFCLASDAHVNPPLLALQVDRTIVYSNVAADNPDLLITLGDDFALGAQGEYPYGWSGQQIVFDTLKRHRSVVDNACHSTSCLFVNGNHEGLFGWTSGTPQYQYILDGKRDYLPVPDSGTFPLGGDDDGRYGAFNWGDVLFIWLDVVGFCEMDPKPLGDNQYYILGDAQRSFLQTTLASSSARWKFVLAHHLFGGVDDCGVGYGRGNANGAYMHDQADLQNMMVQYGVQAFFYGHDHVFSVSEAGGIAYICTGHSGAGCPWTEQMLSCYQPYLVFPTEDGNVAPGHVRVDVTYDGATVSYIRASRESDNGTVIASYVLEP